MGVAEGMSQACLRLISGKAISRRTQSARSHPSRSASTADGLADARPRSPRGSGRPGVGPSPPVETTRSARSRPRAKASGHRLEVVRQGGRTADPDPGLGQRAGQLAGVRVTGLADRQFRADREDLGDAYRPGWSDGHLRSVPQGRGTFGSGDRTKAPLRIADLATEPWRIYPVRQAHLERWIPAAGRQTGSTMADLGPTGFDQFDRIVAIVRRTRELLDAVVADGALPDGGAGLPVRRDPAAPRERAARVPWLASGGCRGTRRTALPDRPDRGGPGRSPPRSIASRR